MKQLNIIIMTLSSMIYNCQTSDRNSTGRLAGLSNIWVSASDKPDDNSPSRLGGLPTVWWPASQVLGGWQSVLAAGLSTLAVGTALSKVTARKGRKRSDTIYREEKRRSETLDRVFRGVEVAPASWPWMAKLKTYFRLRGRRTRKRSCGGALIAERFILTARHCVSWDSTGKVVDGRRVKVWLGSHGQKGEDGLLVPVRRVLARRDYQIPTCADGVWCPDWAFWGHRILTNDIALLELLYPVDATERIKPIHLAATSPGPGVTAWVGGWGLDGEHPTPTLQIAPMAVQKDSYRECKQQMSAGKMCAIGKDFGGPCPGDSGSPLVVYTKHTGPTLVGVVSNGAENCRNGLPGIFTRASYYLDWILLAMERATYTSRFYSRGLKLPFPAPAHRKERQGRQGGLVDDLLSSLEEVVGRYSLKPAILRTPHNLVTDKKNVFQ